jgi:threonine dehydratase
MSTQTSLLLPTFTDVLRAKQIIAPYLPRTPLIHYPALDRLIGAHMLIKHENYQLTGAFKVRGGINLVSQLSLDERTCGVAAASTGNHGQSVAYAAQLFNTRALIVVPEKANPAKVSAMRDMGAEVLFYGKDFDTARVHCEALASEKKMRYVHSGNEPLLIAGVGTIALEIFEDAPEVDVLIVPVGGGSGAAAACLVAKTLKPRVEVIGVQAERAPAACQSWRAKKLLEDTMETAAEGLATRCAFELPQRVLWKHLDDFVLLTEDEIFQAMALCIDQAHTLAEAAGAASLGAAIKLRERLAGKTVALVLTGSNVNAVQLRSALTCFDT